MRTLPLRHGRHAPSDEHWEMGHGRGGRALTGLGNGEGKYRAATKKKVKYHGLVHPYTHEFQVKIHPRQKSGDAVACASVAPVRLHHLIHHKGTNTWRIIAHRGGMGGEVLLHYWQFGAALPGQLIWGFVFESAGRHPKNKFEGDSKPTNPDVAKSYVKSKLSDSSFFLPLPPLLLV
jgi:hypothetical protein